MAITRQKKEEIFAKTKDIFDNSEALVFVHFDKVSGEEIRDMRAELEKEGVSYSVIKKTLIKKAADESKVKGSLPELEGEIAVAYSTEDMTAPARKVKEFSKTLKDRISIVGGFFEGEFKNQAEMTEIANIPSLDVLRGMFVNVINSPIQRCAIALGQIAEKKS
ncbi:50S ribosomal protein L10 [Candidatus Campbellbacteria bacterium]|nr:MAG: 50S ribosomal protein L10 [Candidatus Campbellbacteria bacterium]